MTLKYRIRIYRNRKDDPITWRRFGFCHLRHWGTLQTLIWCGPFFVVARNRRSAEALAKAKKVA